MDTPLISIAVCTYNGEKFLAEQLESILAQTYKNIEVVIVDDGSVDNTLEIINKYAVADDRIKVFRNKVNLGFNKNFEYALSLTSGALIAISDQDDIWELNKLERLKASIGDNWLIFSNSALIYPNGLVKEGKLLNKFEYGNRDFRSILLSNFVTGHTCLMQRHFLKKIRPFPNSGYYDWWMGFVALYHNKLTYLSEMLTQYRVHEASITQTEFNHEQNKQIFYRHTLNMLKSFIGYPGLKEDDRLFISRLRACYEKKEKKGFNPQLTLLIARYYHQIFPNEKKRSFLSALNFARKYSRKF